MNECNIIGAMRTCINIGIVLLASAVLSCCISDSDADPVMDYPPDNPPHVPNDDDCAVHEGDEKDDIEITQIDEEFFEAFEGSVIDVVGNYTLHSREWAFIHAFSCGTISQTEPAYVPEGSGTFYTKYTIASIENQEEFKRCLLVLVYDVDGEKLITCRYEFE